jgi:hypothetical protein
MNDIIQCREALPCLSRPNGMGGELQSEYKNRTKDRYPPNQFVNTMEDNFYSLIFVLTRQTKQRYFRESGVRVITLTEGAK